MLVTGTTRPRRGKREFQICSSVPTPAHVGLRGVNTILRTALAHGTAYTTTQETTAMKLVTNLRIASFSGNSKRISFVETMRDQEGDGPFGR
ncbi:hypothetical protein EVAR_96799_1 [Eumeta japonica]|uniref:Uncharacterized protein n=1 Tax=Eumeta variegata TaxID=151549 RepID=A0A4C1WAY1_EUMVA|nr:hypothetical protein EVAR_96799_1 [Eumeta japonica]